MIPTTIESLSPSPSTIFSSYSLGSDDDRGGGGISMDVVKLERYG